MQRPSQRLVGIAASITLLILLVLAGSEWAAGVDVQKQDDFDVYLTAAQLVREHKGVDIYSDADTGKNPQIRFATVGSTFQRTAASIGIPAVRLYVYPPTLADLLVPFTFLSVEHARDAWLILNLVTLLGAAMLVTWMLFDTVLHVACIGLFIFILCFRANGWSLDEGQVSSILVLLWTAGIACYVKGCRRTSAAVFALAAAIKLTPLLVVLPFLIWREWRWSRWFFLCFAGICVSLCVINGPQSLLDYTLHIMPPMSAGATSCENTSLPSGLQQAYLRLPCSSLVEGTPIPRTLQLVSKLTAGAMMLLVLAGIYRLGPLRSAMERGKILALVALLSLYCSPVAWRSAYGIVFLAALFLWNEAFERGISKLRLLLLVLCTLEFSFFFDTFSLRFAHGALLSATALLAPAFGFFLIFSTLGEMLLSGHGSYPKAGVPPLLPQLQENV